MACAFQARFSQLGEMSSCVLEHTPAHLKPDARKTGNQSIGRKPMQIHTYIYIHTYIHTYLCVAQHQLSITRLRGAAWSSAAVARHRALTERIVRIIVVETDVLIKACGSACLGCCTSSFPCQAQFVKTGKVDSLPRARGHSSGCH